MTKAIIMGLKVEPRIMDTSQSNRGTRGQHLPYRWLYPRGNDAHSLLTISYPTNANGNIELKKG